MQQHPSIHLSFTDGGRRGGAPAFPPTFFSPIGAHCLQTIPLLLPKERREGKAASEERPICGTELCGWVGSSERNMQEAERQTDLVSPFSPPHPASSLLDRTEKDALMGKSHNFFPSEAFLPKSLSVSSPQEPIFQGEVPSPFSGRGGQQD